ncbi:MAG TPA: cation:proton antiporter [Dongiaceae bacterium]|nr:cation:proton antiporter [Dongiaceae bacterium]
MDLHLHLPPIARLAAVALLFMFIPRISSLLRIPTVVCYIFVGMVLGPHGAGVIPRHHEVTDFLGEFGKILLMFFIGLEVELHQLRRSGGKAVAFGLMTFIIPMTAGVGLGLYFGYGPVGAMLVGSLLSSHTLIAFPILQRSGFAQLPSVTIAVGATALSDVLSLLLLAVALTTFQSGFRPEAVLWQVGQLLVFTAVVVFTIGKFGRWLFDRFGRTDEASFWLLVAIAALAATSAELLGLESILGAFIAGLAANTAARATPGRERLKSFGDIFFIPAFFLVTGFLIDLHVLWETIVSNSWLVLGLILVLLISKWLAAEIMGRAWGYGRTERNLIASLTFPQVAATLAAALVGYEAIDSAGKRLLDASMLNAVLVLVTVTSILGPVLTQACIKRLPAVKEQAAARGVH